MNPDDAIRVSLEQELRALRRGPGAFDVDRVAVSPTLTALVGRGVAQSAYSVLMSLLERQSGGPDGDVQAFFETCGVDTPGENLDQRLDAYAVRHHVDPRTGLRRSDRGARKISTILRGGMDQPPRARIEAHEVDGLLTLRVRFEAARHNHWMRPLVLFQGDEPVWHPQLAASEKHPDWLVSEGVIPDLPLMSADGRHLSAQVLVVWTMRTNPYWTTHVTITTPGVGIETAIDNPVSISFLIDGPAPGMK